MNGDFFAVFRFAGDEAFIARSNGKTRHFGHRAEQVDEVGDVIGTHIEHRPAANLVIEGGVGMPALMAGAHEGGGAADRLAKHTLVDQPTRGLVSATEEGIRGRADAQALGPCRIRKAFAFREIDAERLFRIGMFAGCPVRAGPPPHAPWGSSG